MLAVVLALVLVLALALVLVLMLVLFVFVYPPFRVLFREGQRAAKKVLRTGPLRFQYCVLKVMF